MESKTYLEVGNQFDALGKTLEYVKGFGDKCKEFIKTTAPKQTVVMGCGSSFQLSESLAMSISLHAGIPAVALAGGDLMLHTKAYENLFKEKTLMVVFSRSGSTSELINAINKLNEEKKPISVLSIVCKENTELGKLSDFTLELPWAFDESVCQTRSVTNMYSAAISFFALAAENKKILKSYELLAQKGNEYMAKTEEIAKKIGPEAWKSVAVLCDGESFGLAEEASLAFNEIAYTPSTYKHVLDVRHGPIVLFDKDTLAIVRLTAQGMDHEKKLVADLVAKGVQVIIISDVELEKMEGVRAQVAFGEELHEAAAGILIMPMAQYLSYYHALSINVNPDAPQGLDAWIKL